MMDKMETMIKLVKDYLDREQWKYTYDEETHTILTGMKLKCKLQSLRMGVRFSENGYITIAYPALNAGEEYRQDIAEYITRANFGVKNGNFEMDYKDGEIRYKVYTSYKGLNEFSEDIVEESFVIPIVMFERYGDGLAALLFGFSNPKEEIDKAERW